MRKLEVVHIHKQVRGYLADCPAVSLDLYIFRIELEFYMHKVNVGARK